MHITFNLDNPKDTSTFIPRFFIVNEFFFVNPSTLTERLNNQSMQNIQDFNKNKKLKSFNNTIDYLNKYVMPWNRINSAHFWSRNSIK